MTRRSLPEERIGLASLEPLEPRVLLDAYVWHGDGVLGGTGDDEWATAANWLVGGSPAATAPGADDDVTVDFNTAAVNNYALTIRAGAAARNVSVHGLNYSANRKVHVRGDATFSTFTYDTTADTNGGRHSLSIDWGYTLRLTGGSPAEATFKTRGYFSIYSSYGYAGTIECTAENVYLDLEGRHNGLLYVSHPGAVIDFSGKVMELGDGELMLRAGQTVVSLPELYGRERAFSILSAEGRLDFMGDVGLHMSERRGTVRTDAGTDKYIPPPRLFIPRRVFACHMRIPGERMYYQYHI